MNIALFSSSPLSLPLLEKLNTDFSVKLVITNADRPVGRNKELVPSELKTWAIKNSVKYLTPKSLKNELNNDTISTMKQLNIDLSLVIDYGLLIPESIFSLPKFQTINIHFSLLPKYRGPYPDAFVVLNGEKQTAISFVLIDKGFDTGDIIGQKIMPVSENETANELHQKLYKETVQSISYIINSWARWKMGKNYKHYNDYNGYISVFLPPKKQDHKAATFTKLLSRDDGYIDWKILQKIIKNEDINFEDLPELIKKSSQKPNRKMHNVKCTMYNFWRALIPWPGMWTMVEFKINNLKCTIEGKRLKILKLHLENEKIVIDQVQLEGKKPVSWKEFEKNYLANIRNFSK